MYVSCPGHHQSNAAGLFKCSDESLHPASASVRVQCKTDFKRGMPGSSSAHAQPPKNCTRLLNESGPQNSQDCIKKPRKRSRQASATQWWIWFWFSLCMSRVLASYSEAEATPCFICCTSSWMNRVGGCRAGAAQWSVGLRILIPE